MYGLHQRLYPCQGPWARLASPTLQEPLMSRLARRIQMTEHLAAPRARGDVRSPHQRLDTALRSKAARKVRTHLRRMEPVVLFTPRWSAAGRFLEELSLDLAVGEPAIGCRALDLRPLKDRPSQACWQFLLHAVQRLGRRGWSFRGPQTVVDRRGFRWALEQVLESVHAGAPHRVALLAHGAEYLPVEVLSDLTQVLEEYAARHRDAPRMTMLLAGSSAASWLCVGDAPQVDLADFGESEAASAIVGRAGPLPLRHLEEVARFTGGIPSLVEAVGRSVQNGGTLPTQQDALLGSLGRVADEMRGAVDIVAASDSLADRLHSLLDGEPTRWESSVDAPLLQAGLLREVRVTGGRQVALRAPAIAALVG